MSETPKGCDHKFVGSNNCAKCGWEAPRTMRAVSAPAEQACRWCGRFHDGGPENCDWQGSAPEEQAETPANIVEWAEALRQREQSWRDAHRTLSEAVALHPQLPMLSAIAEALAACLGKVAKEAEALALCDARDYVNTHLSDIAALRAEVARLTAENERLQMQYDGCHIVAARHLQEYAEHIRQAEAENARLRAGRDAARMVATQMQDRLAGVQADREALRQQIEALAMVPDHDSYGEGYYAAIQRVLALLGERREEPTQ